MALDAAHGRNSLAHGGEIADKAATTAVAPLRRVRANVSDH
jgi:hypothetical protein